MTLEFWPSNTPDRTLGTVTLGYSVDTTSTIPDNLADFCGSFPGVSGPSWKRVKLSRRFPKNLIEFYTVSQNKDIFLSQYCCGKIAVALCGANK